MKHRCLLIMVLSVLSGTIQSLYSQCMYYPVPFEQRVNNARYIVLGKVIAKETYVNETTGNIQTLNRLQITAWLKNKPQTSEIYIITLGGVLGNKATRVYPSLQLDTQQEYMFLLDREERQSDDKARRIQSPKALQVMAYSDAQGALPLKNGAYRDLLVERPMDEARLFKRIQSITHQPIVTPSGARFAARTYVPEETIARVANVTAVSSFSPTTTNSGTIVPGDYITITGSGFGATPGTILFPNADNGGLGGATIPPPNASDYVSWSDNSITVKVPAQAGTGTFSVNGMASATPLTIAYAHLAIDNTFFNFSQTTRQRFYLRNKNGSGGYTFNYNTSFNSNALAVAAFERALTSWRCATGVNFTASGTTAVATVGDDGVNAVFFDGSLPSGVLGQAFTSYLGGTNGFCDQNNTVWWASDIDIRFKTDPPVAGFPWNYGPGAPTISQFDFESVAIHELGHAHGLGHVIASGQVMHYAISNGAASRILSANDIAGGNAKMVYSTAATCYNPGGSGTPMTAVPAAVCSVLPFGIEKFEGHRRNSNTNTLLWTIRQDNTSTGFYLQRSLNGQSFSDIAFVAVKGPSIQTQKQEYVYDDLQAGATGWYYRLQQAVAGTRSTMSASIFINGSGSAAWRVWGNESGNTLYVSGSSDGMLKLFSASGQLVYASSVHAGVNTLLLNKIPQGIYYYNIVTPSATISQKVMLGR